MSPLFWKHYLMQYHMHYRVWHLKCENVSICEKVARCEEIVTLNVKIDAICEK